MPMTLILASNSPRRKQLLALLGRQFQVMPADVDEKTIPGEPPSEYVRRLAEQKARAVAGLAGKQALILAADTTVVDRGEILGKPADAQQAQEMLGQLRGRTHQVFTALALLSGDQLRVDCCASDVPMRNYSAQEIQAYIASGDPMDKAGAYAIQHAGFNPVTALEGCYANVVGLPLCHLARNLQAFGIQTDPELPQACQAALGISCPVYETILKEVL